MTNYMERIQELEDKVEILEKTVKDLKFNIDYINKMRSIERKEAFDKEMRESDMRMNEIRIKMGLPMVFPKIIFGE